MTNPFIQTRYELFRTDGSFYATIKPRASERHPALASSPGEPALDGKGRALVEWKGSLYRVTL